MVRDSFNRQRTTVMNIISRIFCVIFMAISVVFLVRMAFLNVLPTKYYLIAILVLIVLNLIFFHISLLLRSSMSSQTPLMWGSFEPSLLSAGLASIPVAHTMLLDRSIIRSKIKCFIISIVLRVLIVSQPWGFLTLWKTWTEITTPIAEVVGNLRMEIWKSSPRL